jgi:hypothetical protein
MSPEDRNRIFRESKRILEAESTPRAVPVREPPPIVIEDELAKWKREADEADRLREANRSRLRRQERETHTRTEWETGVDVRLAALEERVDAIESHLAGFDAVADGAASFSDAVTTRLHALDALSARLDVTLTGMRELHEREVKALRDQLTAVQAAGARENAFLSQQLGAARREIDVLNGQVEHKRDRAELATLTNEVGNVVTLLRQDIANRS